MCAPEAWVRSDPRSTNRQSVCIRVRLGSPHAKTFNGSEHDHNWAHDLDLHLQLLTSDAVESHPLESLQDDLLENRQKLQQFLLLCS